MSDTANTRQATTAALGCDHESHYYDADDLSAFTCRGHDVGTAGFRGRNGAELITLTEETRRAWCSHIGDEAFYEHHCNESGPGPVIARRWRQAKWEDA